MFNTRTAARAAALTLLLWCVEVGSANDDGTSLSTDKPAQLRVRTLRGQARSLRLEIDFVHERLAALVGQRERTFQRLALYGPDQALLEQVQQIFTEREARLRSRLEHLQDRLQEVHRAIARRAAAPELPPIQAESTASRSFLKQD